MTLVVDAGHRTVHLLHGSFLFERSGIMGGEYHDY